MIKKSILLSALGIFFLCGTANSQTKKESRDTSSTVIIFNSGPAKAESRSGENNIIKVSPLAFISGKIPFSYERRLTDLLSIQFSGGLTTKNYTNSWVLGTMDNTEEREIKFVNSPLPDNVNDVTDPTFNYDNRKASLGYMFSVQPRLYFENEGLEGAFMGISADFYKYNFEIPAWRDNGNGYEHSGEMKKEYENVRDIMVSYGWQRLYDRLSVEYSVAAGVRKISGVKYVAGVDNNDQELYEGDSKYTKNGLNFGLSLKVGYHF